MKLWISVSAGLLAMMFCMPHPAAAEPRTVQPQVIRTQYVSREAYYRHWHSACRDPRFRRHHPFLCW